MQALVGVLLSVLPDFDHIPHVKKALRSGRFGVESRSSLHELVGLVLVLFGSLGRVLSILMFLYSVSAVGLAIS